MDGLELQVGEDVEFSLPGRGTAGYSWICRIEGPDAVLAVSRIAAPPPAASVAPRTGSAADVFLLRGLAAGRVMLNFELRRPWEQGQPAAQQRQVEVEVRAQPP